MQILKSLGLPMLVLFAAAGCSAPNESGEITIDREQYLDRMEGFWLGQSLANWTGLVTEADKIGGEGPAGVFYTRDDWGGPDQPRYGGSQPSRVSPIITWVVREEGEIWGSDDDTDIEYIYQHLLQQHERSILSAEQIRDGWLSHIYSDDNSPHRVRGQPENFLWVSNQRAFDLMYEQGLLPPATSDPENNEHYDMIDAQLTTEVFGLYAPGRPDMALKMAYLPVRVTAHDEAALAAEFYIIMHSLAAVADPAQSRKEQIHDMAAQARALTRDDSYIAKMHDFVLSRYQAGVSWEQARDDVYQRYQVEEQDGYNLSDSGRTLSCNGCFAAGINFAASMVSLYFGEGEYQETVKIAVLAGWDSDNPAATWGGLIGFMSGGKQLEAEFGIAMSERFNINATRYGFPLEDGIDTFPAMAVTGRGIVDRVVVEELEGSIDGNMWRIPAQ
jgi:hypothetical protein